jgi:hypothetical protein
LRLGVVEVGRVRRGVCCDAASREDLSFPFYPKVSKILK